MPFTGTRLSIGLNPHLGFAFIVLSTDFNLLCAKLERGLGSFMLLGMASWLGNKKLPWLRQFVFIKGTISAELPDSHPRLSQMAL